MSIHSGLTKSMTEEIKKIYDAEDHGVDFMDWNGFLDSFEQLSHADPDKQIDMLGSLLLCKPAPAYRYLTYALLELFQGDSLTRSQFQEKAENVFAEAEATQNANTTARYEQPLLKELTDLVFDRMVKNGFSAPEKNTEITVQLWSKQSRLTRKGLCEILFSNKPMTKNKLKTVDTSKAKETFFALSLGLSFDISFVQDYIKRVLRTPELNVWDIKEVLVYVLLKNPSQTNNPYASYRKLLDQYENAEPAAPAQTGEQQTEEVKGLAEQLANALLATSPDSSAVQSLLSQYKYLKTQQPENVQKDQNVVNTRLEEMRPLTPKQKENANYGSAREEKIAGWEHLHTANRLFLDLCNSVENRLQKFEKIEAEHLHFIAKEQCPKGLIGKFLYGLSYEYLFDSQYAADAASFAEMIAPILEQKKLDQSRISGISHGKKEVCRDELLTLAFLDRALDFMYFDEKKSVDPESELVDSKDKPVDSEDKPVDPSKRPPFEMQRNRWKIVPLNIECNEDSCSQMDSFREYINRILIESGFDEMYPLNPYDSFLLYLSCTDEPFLYYCAIWSIYLAYTNQEKKEADK